MREQPRSQQVHRLVGGPTGVPAASGAEQGDGVGRQQLRPALDLAERVPDRQCPLGCVDGISEVVGDAALGGVALEEHGLVAR